MHFATTSTHAQMLFDHAPWCLVMEEFEVLSLFIVRFLAGRALIGTAHHAMSHYQPSIALWCQLLIASTTWKNQPETEILWVSRYV